MISFLPFMIANLIAGQPDDWEEVTESPMFPFIEGDVTFMDAFGINPSFDLTVSKRPMNIENVENELLDVEPSETIKVVHPDDFPAFSPLFWLNYATNKVFTQTLLGPGTLVFLSGNTMEKILEYVGTAHLVINRDNKPIGRWSYSASIANLDFYTADFMADGIVVNVARNDATHLMAAAIWEGAILPHPRIPIQKFAYATRFEFLERGR